MSDESPFDSLKSTLAFDARDWSENRADAWIYGIVAGWGAALEEVAWQHRWDLDDQARLMRLHRSFVEAASKSSPQSSPVSRDAENDQEKQDT